MSRIKNRFEALAQDGRKAVIPYIVAGDPAVSATVPLLHALVEAGADLLEVGVPFSDPMAEGPVIQLGHERALANGVTLSGVLDMVAEFRRDDAETPVLLMGYANPVEHMGYEVFADAATAAGVDGLLVVDIPPEEIGQLQAVLSKSDIDNILLVAPTTSPQRLAAITAAGTGFIYYVALKGVTGATNIDTAAVADEVAAVRKKTNLPVAVGFGIRDAASARAIAAVADGVIVGSALVDAMSRAGDGAQAAAVALLRELRDGVDSLAS